MNILKYFRNPKFVILSALGFLIFSCSQYELNKPKEFSFEDFNNFIESGIEFSNVSIDNFSNQSFRNDSNTDIVIQLNQVQDAINEYYGTNIDLSDERLTYIYSERDIDNIKSYLQNENLMVSSDFYLYDDFVDNSKTIGFEQAMNSYETEILNRNLSESEFNNYNLIANTLRVVENQNPELFQVDSNSSSEFSRVADGRWRCVLEYVFWVVSVVVTVAACLGPQALFFCLAAIANLVRQTLRTAEACAGYM